MPEYALTRNYLDLMVELPWNRSTKGERRSREKWSLMIFEGSTSPWMMGGGMEPPWREMQSLLVLLDHRPEGQNQNN